MRLVTIKHFVSVYTHIVMYIKFSFRKAKKEEEVGVSTRELPVYTFRILTYSSRGDTYEW